MALQNPEEFIKENRYRMRFVMEKGRGGAASSPEGGQSRAAGPVQ